MWAVPKEYSCTKSTFDISGLIKERSIVNFPCHRLAKAVGVWATYLNTFQNCEHEQVLLRVSPSDYDPLGGRSREVIRPKYPQKPIVHDHVVILHSIFKTTLGDAAALAQRRRDSRGEGAVLQVMLAHRVPIRLPLSSIGFVRYFVRTGSCSPIDLLSMQGDG